MTRLSALPAWFEVVRLHPDVESGEFTRATFAIDFGGVVNGDPRVPAVYRDPRAFWRATYLTSELRRLLEEVLGRLAGGAGDRVLQLRSPFGGGKSHILVALYHAVRARKVLEEILPEARSFPDPGTVRVAAVDGEKFDPMEGMEVNGIRVRTLWGAIAAWLGCFDLVREHEGNRTAPGGSVVKAMLEGGPTLILLDEILRYVERGLTISVGESTLGRQTMEFLQTLTTEVAGSSNSVMVFSLQASAREALDNVGLLSTLDHLVARQDAKREPMKGDEVLEVLKKRLLAEPPPTSAARRVAQAMAHTVAQWKTAEAPDSESRRLAQDEEVRLTSRLESAYPFHPALIDLMKGRWASLPHFQRTRGALRFMATVLHKAKKMGHRSPVISPGDIPLEDADVRNAFFSEVLAEPGQRDQYQAVLEHDFISPNARVKRIDEQLSRENPALASIKPATRLATAIFMYSFGGLPQEEKGETLPPGVTERELLEACLAPGLDSITAQTVLKRLRDPGGCLFLHFDGVHYCFKTVGNVNQFVEEEADHIREEEVRGFLRGEIEKRVGQATRAAVIWPERSEQIPDQQPCFLLAYMPLEFAEKPQHVQDEMALTFLTQCGNQLRRYRNGLGLVVPNRQRIVGLRRAARYLLAIERVRAKRSSYRLTKEQIDQLKEQESTEKAALESDLRGLYSAVWLLKIEQGQPTLEKVDAAGRPLRKQGVHERIMELLTEVHRKVFESVTPHKMISLLGLASGERKAMETRLVRDLFFESMDFPRVMNESVLVEAIVQGVQQGVLAYTLKGKVREEGDECQVKSQDAYFRCSLSPDEIDLDSGVILLPECIVEPAPSLTPSGQEEPPQPKSALSPLKTPEPKGARGAIKSIRIAMKLKKASLYKTFNALGNLADKTENKEIRVIVEAENLNDVDRVWLRNAVLEPLDEADVEYQHEVGEG